jgi:hypothetical protein
MADKEEAWRGLADTARILDDLKVPWVLDGGTLLGMVRDAWFFPHDYDIDITVIDQHARLSEVWRTAVRAGYRSRGPVNLGPPERTRKLFLHQGSAKVDIVSKVEQNGMALWTLMHNRSLVKSAPVAFYEQTRVLTIRDVDLRVPLEAEAYLSWRFGPWREDRPATTWSKYRDDRAYVDARNTGRALPASFPAHAALRARGFFTYDSLTGLTEAALVRWPGVTRATARVALEAARASLE